MYLTFLGHSGFYVQFSDCDVVFDFYEDPKQRLKPLLDAAESAGRPVLFLVSHWHADHYNPDIWLAAQRSKLQVYYVIEADTLRRVKSLPEWVIPERVKGIGANEHLALTDWPFASIHGLQTFESNDEGVAFLLDTAEGLVYHAGDLNAWYWSDGSEIELMRRYATSLQAIQEVVAGRSLALAMLPLDARLADHAFDGVVSFTEQISVEAICTMHHFGDPSMPQKLKARYPDWPILMLEAGDTQAVPIV